MDSEKRAFEEFEADYNNTVAGTVFIGACTRRYEFLYDLEDSDNHFHGKYFVDGEDGHNVTFKKVGGKEEARTFYNQTSAVTSEYVSRPWFYTYCQQKSFGQSIRFTQSDIAKGFWVVCYEPFEKGLDEWLTKARSKEIREADLKKRDPSKGKAGMKGKGGLKLGGKSDFKKVTAFSKLPVILPTNSLQPWWCSSIRSLLDGISHIHENDRFHGSLMKLDCYVMRGNEIKIIHVGGRFEADQDEQAKEVQKKNDLMDFRVMLDTLLVRGPTPPCDDVGRFFQYFEFATAHFSCSECIKRLRGHPFLKLPKDRLDYISEIIRKHHGREFLALTDAVENGVFDDYKGWDRSIKEMDDFLIEHYGLAEMPYKGDDIFGLLRFIRNLYLHYKQLKCRDETLLPAVTMEEVDSAVRRNFGGIIELVYQIENM